MNHWTIKGGGNGVDGQLTGRSNDVKEFPILQILRYTAFHLLTTLSLRYVLQSMSSYN